MDKKSSLTVKKSMAILTSFILTFGVSLLSLCVSLSIISRFSFMKNIIKESNYVEYATQEIKEDLSDLAIPSGLPINFFEDKVTAKQVEDFVLKSAEYNFTGGVTPDFSYIKNDILSEINSYAAENFVSIDDKTNKAIGLLSDECFSVFSRYCNPPIVQFFTNLIKSLSRVLIYGIGFSVVLFSLTVLFLFKLVKGREFWFYSFSSFMGASLLLGIIPLILLITNKISHIAITSKSLYSFLCSFVNGGLITVLFFSVLVAVISLLFLYLEHRKKN